MAAATWAEGEEKLSCAAQPSRTRRAPPSSHPLSFTYRSPIVHLSFTCRSPPVAHLASRAHLSPQQLCVQTAGKFVCGLLKAITPIQQVLHSRQIR